jgi:protein tyrosine/serine phosphatase
MPSRSRRLVAISPLLALSLPLGAPSCATLPAIPADVRPARWAEPLALTGVPNLHRVSASLYRSAQPTPEGMRNLEQAGFRGVVNLRYFHTDTDELAGTGLREYHLPTLTWSPRTEDLETFLDIVGEAGTGPMLVHCHHGADRTGAFCSIYRIRVEGWHEADAISEMLYGGYGFHRIWGNLPKWVREQGRHDPRDGTKHRHFRMKYALKSRFLLRPPG